MTAESAADVKERALDVLIPQMQKSRVQVRKAIFNTSRIFIESLIVEKSTGVYQSIEGFTLYEMTTAAKLLSLAKYAVFRVFKPYRIIM